MLNVEKLGILFFDSVEVHCSKYQLKNLQNSICCSVYLLLCFIFLYRLLFLLLHHTPFAYYLRQHHNTRKSEPTVIGSDLAKVWSDI